MPLVDPEARRAYNRAYRAKNKHKVKKWNDEAYAKNGAAYRAHNREYWHSLPVEKRREYTARYRNKNRKLIAERNREKRRELKILVINAYGGVCAKCGFSDIRALCVDHVNGGGIQDRALISGDFYRHVRDEGFPIRYQVLCANCNMIKAIENKEIGRKWRHDLT